ncbi:anthranilate synthase component I family protein [Sporosarcina trichiuri]|uniref:anthranilate synthase component I family protein n=1 Tax=Sporosarcina trichiuri TaxID=3056445 RepID=UPI0025B38563|nr:chorismate-binding protein [Sporosarcina sp. 0.2-SM1T-5]WJY26938.1 chorismate-binding protein [Sporosarcina sp. 0.2-SM1T-5]
MSDRTGEMEMEAERMTSRVTEKKMDGKGLTPVQLLRRLGGERCFLLESSAGDGEHARYSFIGADPIKSYKGRADGLQEIDYRKGTSVFHEGELFSLLKQLIPRVQDDSPFPFTGGAVGYVSYEAGDPQSASDGAEPSALYHLYDTIIIFDHQLDEVTVRHTELTETPEEMDLETIAGRLLSEDENKSGGTAELSAFRSGVSQREFEADVQTALDVIHGGGAEQIVLSRRMEADVTGDPLAVYERLRQQNPSPYMYYLESDEQIILGASPESLVKVLQGIVQTNPIAGTRPRGRGRQDDEALETSLRNDPKELAEHDMLVESGKLEMEQFCEKGTVRIAAYQETIRYEHVMHLVSELEGQLAPGNHAVDALEACLPAGTVTGNPKRTAMEWIRKIERMPRGVYGGAIGYIGLNGNLDAALAIRTMIIRNGRAYVQAGAGIVAASVPHNEYLETVYKSRSLTALSRQDV